MPKVKHTLLLPTNCSVGQIFGLVIVRNHELLREFESNLSLQLEMLYVHGDEERMDS